MILGTCSECGGPVEVPVEATTFVTIPVPTCQRCGATAKNPYGAIMPMNPAPRPEAKK